MISNNDLRMIRAATAISMESSYPRIKIGAVLARKTTAVGIGFNQSKSHPKQKEWNDAVGRKTKQDSLHAEMCALMATFEDDVSDCTMYVGRLTKDYKNAMCRPCEACMAAIRHFGIKRIVYLTPDGVAEEHLN